MDTVKPLKGSKIYSTAMTAHGPTSTSKKSNQETYVYIAWFNWWYVVLWTDVCVYVCVCICRTRNKKTIQISGKIHTHLFKMVTNLRYKISGLKEITLFILWVLAVLLIFLYQKDVMFYNVKKEKKC